MLKKILIAVFMMTLIVAQNVFAQDVWVYTDRNSGIEYYVMTETAKYNSPKYAITVDVKVKYVRNSKLLGVHDYNFYSGEAVTTYKVDGKQRVNGTMLESTVYGKGTENEAATAIYEYCWDYLDIKRKENIPHQG